MSILNVNDILQQEDIDGWHKYLVRGFSQGMFNQPIYLFSREKANSRGFVKQTYKEYVSEIDEAILDSNENKLPHRMVVIKANKE